VCSCIVHLAPEDRFLLALALAPAQEGGATVAAHAGAALGELDLGVGDTVVAPACTEVASLDGVLK